MKSRKLSALCLVAVVLSAVFTLTGCQLAREDGEESQDRLIGVFLTTSYLELDGEEAQMKGAIWGAIRSTNPTSSVVTQNRPQGRLYAALADRILTSEETGATTTYSEYVFQGIEGISFFTATVPATEDNGSYTSTGSDSAISDGHAALHFKDNEDTIDLDGTIYLSIRHPGVIWYINPVYQSTDGSVYTTAGSGISFSGDTGAAGARYSTTLKETTTVTENGKAKSATTSVKISLAPMYPPEQVAVIQMGQGYHVLASAEYAPTELPSTFAPQAETQFIVVETRWRDHDGNFTVSRALYGKDDNSMETFYCREDGVCVKQSTSIKWGEGR